MYYLTKEDYLEHRASGWSKKNHKYISRKLVNGKWKYTYKKTGGKGGRIYTKFEDLLGLDEAADYRNAEHLTDEAYKEWETFNNQHPDYYEKYVQEKHRGGPMNIKIKQNYERGQKFLDAFGAASDREDKAWTPYAKTVKGFIDVFKNVIFK